MTRSSDVLLDLRSKFCAESACGSRDGAIEGFGLSMFVSPLALSKSSSSLFTRRSSSTLVVFDPPVRPRGSRARFGKTQFRLDRSHAEHGLVLLHLTFRFRQLVQLKRWIALFPFVTASATTFFGWPRGWRIEEGGSAMGGIGEVAKRLWTWK